MLRAPPFVLAVILTVLGIHEGIMAWQVDAPYIWAVGYSVATYGLWLGHHTWRRLSIPTQEDPDD
jgi:hypothetical protein